MTTRCEDVKKTLKKKKKKNWTPEFIIHLVLPVSEGCASWFWLDWLVIDWHSLCVIAFVFWEFKCLHTMKILSHMMIIWSKKIKSVSVKQVAVNRIWMQRNLILILYWICSCFTASLAFFSCITMICLYSNLTKTENRYIFVISHFWMSVLFTTSVPSLFHVRYIVAHSFF